MAELATIETIVGALKVLPQVVEVGKDIWKEIKSFKEPKSEDLNGVVKNTYYSSQYKFNISVPNMDRWRFWKPTLPFLITHGQLLLAPGKDFPILILSNDFVKLWRPTVSVVIEEIGTYTTINDLVNVSLLSYAEMGVKVLKKNIHIFPEQSSAIIICTKPYVFETTLYNVQQFYIYSGLAYYISAMYVPLSESSPAMFPDLHEIMNSFTIIKDIPGKK